MIITYGMGYIYFVDLTSGKVFEKMRLFEEIDYELNSFENVDTCCYYNEYTRI